MQHSVEIVFQSTNSRTKQRNFSCSREWENLILFFLVSFLLCPRPQAIWCLKWQWQPTQTHEIQHSKGRKTSSLLLQLKFQGHGINPCCFLSLSLTSQDRGQSRKYVTKCNRTEYLDSQLLTRQQKRRAPGNWKVSERLWRRSLGKWPVKVFINSRVYPWAAQYGSNSC